MQTIESKRLKARAPGAARKSPNWNEGDDICEVRDDGDI
jgi:hypothetical protein